MAMGCVNDGGPDYELEARVATGVNPYDKIKELEAQLNKLAAFKKYVHERLDEAGVPVDPESPHKDEGCRIGGRLDWLLARLSGITIEKMQQEAYVNSERHGFHSDPTLEHPAIKLALIHSEVSEALEDVREGHMTMAFDLASGKPVGLPSELADIVIRVGDLAEQLGITLTAAVKAKMDYNLSRPFKHGSKGF